jgi:hypothetical protein
MALQGASGIETPTPLCLRALGGSTFLYLPPFFFLSTHPEILRLDPYYYYPLPASDGETFLCAHSLPPPHTIKIP